MPIVASRADEIRKRIAQLADPKTRPAAILRLKALGPRVPAHIGEDLARMTPEARAAIAEVLRDVDTADARAILKKLSGAAPQVAAGPAPAIAMAPAPEDAEANALNELRALPPPRAGEAASISRRRGEAHLALARNGSRLARKDLLACLAALGGDRARLYCEAAGLIGDTAFVPVLADLATGEPDGGAADALRAIAARERLTARSKTVKDLEDAPRAAALAAIATGRTGTKAG